MDDELYAAVIGGLTLIPVFGSVAGVIRDGMDRRIAGPGTCPACGHPDHPSFCMAIVGPRMTCGCDLMTDPMD